MNSELEESKAKLDESKTRISSLESNLGESESKLSDSSKLAQEREEKLVIFSQYKLSFTFFELNLIENYTESIELRNRWP